MLNMVDIAKFSLIETLEVVDCLVLSIGRTVSHDTFHSPSPSYDFGNDNSSKNNVDQGKER